MEDEQVVIDNENESSDDISYKEKYEKARIALKETRKATKELPDIDRLVEEKLEQRMKAFEQGSVEDILSEMTDDSDEATKIKEIYQSRIRSGGFSRSQIKKDLEDARILANKDKYQTEAEKRAKKTLAETQAMKMAAVGKTTSSSEGEDVEDYSAFSPADLALMERYKIKPSQIK